ncbi:dTDP-L-rhamnose 4-epimerase [subsurface metagenome]
MSKKILVTGGAGFIGSHLVDKLIEEKNHDVFILDNLEKQVHGNLNKPPEYLHKEAKFVKNSVTNYNEFKDLVKECEIIFHLGAVVGVGQSMYQIRKYVETNILGTANLLDILVNCEHSIEKLIIASSNTVYGEGKAKCSHCGIVYPLLRNENQLIKKEWEIKCPDCGLEIKPVLTDENNPFNSSSIYALSKQSQEHMSLLIGKTYGLNTTVLRFFLVYGPRQALSNPYTGVCSIFSTRLLNEKPVIVFEDGLQSRDFVHVSDICQALVLAMENDSANGEIFNVGTGMPTTIKEVAEIITEKINPSLNPLFTHQYRIGDIRHCVANISKIKNKLGYKPNTNFKEGIDDLINWIRNKEFQIKDKSQNAIDELKEKGLLK